MLLLQYDTISSIPELMEGLNEMVRNLDNASNVFVILAKAIGAIMIVFMLATDISKSYMVDHKIDITRYWFPICLSLLLGMYSLVGKTIDQFSKSMQKEITKNIGGYGVGGIYERIGGKISDEEIKAARSVMDETEKTDAKDFEDKNVEAAKQTLRDAVNQKINQWQGGFFNFGYQIKRFFHFLTTIIGSVASFIMSSIILFRTKILLLIGPLAIGISMIPAYQNSIANFFARIIQFSIWIPLVEIINAIVGKMAVRIPANMDGFGILIALVAFQIFLYFQVPKIAADCVMLGQKNNSGSIQQVMQIISGLKG